MMNLLKTKKDEIVTISTGNIKSYQEIASIDLPGGGQSVTLSAVVSIGKLISYAQSKGAKAEFAGQAFLQEMRLRQLNKENELQALHNLVKAESYLLRRMYDFELVLHEPFANGDNYILPASILLTRNNYYKEAYSLFKSTLDKLALSESDRKAWIDNGLEVTGVNFAFEKGWYLRNSTKDIRDALEPLRSFCEEASNAFSLIVNEETTHIYQGLYNSSNRLKGAITLVYESDNKASPFFISRLKRENVASATRISDLEFSSYNGLSISHFYAPDEAAQKSGGEQLCLHIELTPEEIGALKSVEVTPADPRDFQNSSTLASDEATINEADIPEGPPRFQGGEPRLFASWVAENLVYPENAKKNKTQGTVQVQFTIYQDGSVQDVKVVQQVDPELDAEAIRVIKSSPKWTPAKQDGRLVKVTFRLPVVFSF